MISIQLSILFFTQKFISSTYFYENMSRLLIFVSIRMIFQSQSSVILLHFIEVTSRNTLQQLIGILIQLQFLQSLFQSLHLLYILLYLLMALKQMYNDVVNYFLQQQQRQKQPKQSDEMPHLARINRLSTLLKDSNYLEIHRQQICMFYSNLIKQYPSSRTTLNLPKFLYQPPIYIQKVIFTIPLVINTGKIYCILELVIIFPEELDKNIPEFYIKNPDYNKYKPNNAYFKFAGHKQQGKQYEAVMGGLRVLMPQSSNERWQWTSGKYYKQQNITNMVRWIHKFLLIDHFPFKTRRKEKCDSVQPQAKSLAQFIKKLNSSVPTLTQSLLLDNIQDLDALARSVQHQTNNLKTEIVSLQNIQKESQQYQIQQFLPVPKDTLSQNILQSVSSIQALKDTLDLLQHKLMNKQIDLNEFMQLAQILSKKQFEERAKINQMFRVELL